MYSDVDLIVAPATAMGVRAPLAVVRVSGDGAWSVLARCFKSRKVGGITPWRMSYGDWRDGDGVVDDVMVVGYRAPRSYTGQDMLEIFCHGNPLFVDLVVASVLVFGGRWARPGEFTMRAVLNGKMGLLEAESVHSLIESNTRYQADLVRRQADGPLVPFVRARVEEILQVQAHIEATIDYGEEDIDALERGVLLAKMARLVEVFEELARTGSFARSLRRGFKVLLTGSPNVGKSTLFNALVRQERAIVTELPGTTRDLISEEIELDGLPIVLIDSAGVRETDDRIESLGIERIYRLLGDVDLVLFLCERGREAPPYEKILSLPRDRWITVHTKADLAEDGESGASFSVSALTGAGIAGLEREIVLRLSADMKGQPVYLINQRQEETIQGVIACLRSAHDDYESGYGEEVLSSYLNSARRLLGELTGETTVEDVLDRMFSNFCLGK